MHGLENLSPGELLALPATGTAHGHVRVLRRLDGRWPLARICYAHPGDPSAEARLTAQATAFERAAPAAATPHLLAVVPPNAGVPGGILLVEFIAGRAPKLPDDLPSIAAALARLHDLPLPAPERIAPLVCAEHPAMTLLQAIETNAPFFERLSLSAQSRAMLHDELNYARDFATRHGSDPAAITFALADTHPGNFLIDRAGKIWFVDLEKAHYGSPAIDLAHATLPTSTLWDPSQSTVLNRGQTVAFYRAYGALAPERMQMLRPMLTPLRRMTWLRTMAFKARWKVQTSLPYDGSDPGQWSDSGLMPAMRQHLANVIERAFQPATIAQTRHEWLGPEPLDLGALNY
ncbi:MAG: phosphotransferase [Rhodospirillales bacterium]